MLQEVALDNQQQDEKNQAINKLRQADLIFFIFLTVLCVLWLIPTFKMPFETELTWPAILPLFLLVTILAMVGSMFVYLYIPNPEYRNLSALFAQSLKGIRNIRGQFYRACWTILLLFGYWILLRYLPNFLPAGYSYLIATPFFILVLIATFRAAPVWLAILAALLSTVGLWFIFGVLYRVPLP
jgi:hypothetical protein